MAANPAHVIYFYYTLLVRILVSTHVNSRKALLGAQPVNISLDCGLALQSRTCYFI